MPKELKKRTYTEGFLIGQERLRSVMKAGRALNSTLDLDEVLTQILDLSREQLSCERATVFLPDDGRENLFSFSSVGGEIKEITVPIKKGLAGAAFRSRTVLNISAPYHDNRFDKSFDQATGFNTRNILSIPVLDRNNEAIGVIQALNKSNGSFDESDEEVASIFATFAAIAVENAKTVRYRLERERIDNELRMAQNIQATFLQGEIPEFEGYQLAATSRPCYQIGGDYLRLARISEEEYLAVVADVSGKGIPAALITLALHAYLTLLIPMNQADVLTFSRHAADTDYLQLLNKLLCEVTRGKTFIAFCSLLINRKTDKIKFCNCGHTSVILVSSNGKIREFEAKTPVLGILPGIEPVYESIEMRKNELLCLYTDGVNEASCEPAAEDGSRTEFGNERLMKVLISERKSRAGEILSKVLSEVDAFAAGYPSEDDTTLLIIRKE